MNQTFAQHEQLSTVAASAQQCLSFRLDNEEYAVDILKVQEIKGYSAVTPIPNAPPHIKGVMNLRGTVIPIIGLREKFGLPPVTYDKFTVVVILRIGSKVAGLVVDAVSDVLDMKECDVRPKPDLGTKVDTSCITGMLQHGERLVILIDVERVVSESGSALDEAPAPVRALEAAGHAHP